MSTSFRKLNTFQSALISKNNRILSVSQFSTSSSSISEEKDNSITIDSSEKNINILKNKHQNQNQSTSLNSKIDLKPPRGLRDFYPLEMKYRNWLFNEWRQVSELFNFEEYDSSILENESLFIRKAGEEVCVTVYICECLKKNVFFFF